MRRRRPSQNWNGGMVNTLRLRSSGRTLAEFDPELSLTLPSTPFGTFSLITRDWLISFLVLPLANCSIRLTTTLDFSRWSPLTSPSHSSVVLVSYLFLFNANTWFKRLYTHHYKFFINMADLIAHMCSKSTQWITLMDSQSKWISLLNLWWFSR